jgi:hypothetical protein
LSLEYSHPYATVIDIAGQKISRRQGPGNMIKYIISEIKINPKQK